MPVIRLGASEIQYCTLLAERRNVVKEVCGIRSQRVYRGAYDSATNFEIHLIGLIGEFAVSKHFNIKVDASVSLSGDDKITDLTVDGVRVQVKTRLPQKPPLYLYFNDLSLFRADRAVCTCLTGPATVHILGWIDRERFAAKARELNFGYGKRVGVPQQELLEMKDW